MNRKFIDSISQRMRCKYSVHDCTHPTACRNDNRALKFETLEPRQLLATIAVQSGDWFDASTWDNGIPTATERAIISQGLTVTLNGIDHVADEIVVHGVMTVQENAFPKTLTADWIHVNSGGVFQIGTAANRFDSSNFTLTLTGADITADHVVETVGGTMTVEDNDGFLMTAMGGQLQFFGKDKLSFNKLAATAEIGSNTITLENVIERNFDGSTSAASDGTLNWEVGDQIVVASSSYDYADEEVRTITNVNNTGNQTVLTLDAPLANRHYGEIETYDNGARTWDIDMRAEVALLSHNITLQGTQDTDAFFGDRANYDSGAAGGNLGIGAHTMIMPGSGQITIDNVRFDKMGQTAQLGRYPMHWHVAGDRTGDVMRNSSVTNSNNRGVTIHGTQGVVLEGNVLHDIHGHGYFLEDAAEFDNQFLHNIAFGIHQVGGANGNVFNSDDPFIVPGVTRGPDGMVNGLASQTANVEGSHDIGQNLANRFRHSSAFWITNPDNTWVGNISAGSEGSSFWFALPDRVIGLSKDTGLYDHINPLQTNVLQFDHNTSHSTPVGLTFDRGSDIRVGGSNFYSPPQAMQINYYTGYKHIGTAVYHRAGSGTFNESRFADNSTSSFNTFSQSERNILFVGHSQGNADPATLVGGYRLYDGPGRIYDSHFAGFAAENAHTFVVEGGANKFTMTSAEGISYENDGTANHVSINHLSEGGWSVNSSPEFFAGRPDSISGLVLDIDGSLTGPGGGSAGMVLTPKLDYFRDSTDIVPTGWNSYISDDQYAQFKIGINHQDNLPTQHVGGNQGEYIPEFRIENGDGNAIVADRWNLTYVQRMYTKLNAGDYTIEFKHHLPQVDYLPEVGFDVMLQVRRHSLANSSTVFRLVDVGSRYKPAIGVEVSDIDQLRAASETSFFRDLAGDLWLKIFATGDGNSSVNIPINPVWDPPTPSDPNPLIVTNTNDSGVGSLRDAILFANSNPGIDYINFDIDGGGTLQTITPLTPLPIFTDQIIIDGSTQAMMPVPDDGFEFPVQPNNRYELANGTGGGSLAGSAWSFTGAAGITRNLSSFQSQRIPAPFGSQHAMIQNTGSFSQTISGFEVGKEYQLNLLTMARQGVDFGNNLTAILDARSPSELVLVDISEVTFASFTDVNSITFLATKTSYELTIEADRGGGALTGNRTTFVDNVFFSQVVGPRIPNTIVIDGSSVGTGNGLEFLAESIAGSLTVNNFAGGAGIHIGGTGGSTVELVWAGLNANGTAAASNQIGVRLVSDTNILRSSILSGNIQDGLRVDTDGITTSDDNLIAGNLIGTDPSGSGPLSNGINGVHLNSAVGNILFFNVIGFNESNGVVVSSADSISNTIRANSIHSNDLLAIDLGDDGVTANDALDPDNGPNELSNYPVLISAKTGGLYNATIKGGMKGKSNTTYTIDFYANDSFDPSGHGQGQQFVASSTVTTNHRGEVKFSIAATVQRGKFLSATATDPTGNTSEFSATIEVKAREPLSRSGNNRNRLESVGQVEVVEAARVKQLARNVVPAKERLDVLSQTSNRNLEVAPINQRVHFNAMVPPPQSVKNGVVANIQAKPHTLKTLELDSAEVVDSQSDAQRTTRIRAIDNFFESYPA